MKIFKILSVLSIFTLFGCELIEDYDPRYAPNTTLYIYGGWDHKIYLGKFNASEFDSESIWNEFSEFGNMYDPYCIWNPNGEFGSEYSDYSPFNAYANYPPGLYDRYNNFYGYFTADKLMLDRANYEVVDIICDNYYKIRYNLDFWYDRIFY